MIARRFVAALAVTVALGGCTAKIAREPGASSPSPTDAASIGYEDLAATLFTDAGAGYIAVPDETKGLSVDDAVAGDQDAQRERDRLEEHGYVRGYIRTWSSDDDSETVLYAFVYEFKDPSGAAADTNDGIDQATKDGDTLFDVPGIQGATGIKHVPKPGDQATDSTFFAVVFTRGNRTYLVTIGGPTGHSAEEAIAMAKKMDALAKSG